MSRNKWVRNNKGQSSVELAFVLPILFMIIFGIIEFGLIFNSYIVVSNASREGARQAAVGNIDGIETTVEKYGAEIVKYDGKPYKGSNEYGEEIIVTASKSIDAVTSIVGPIIINAMGGTDGNMTIRISTSMRVEDTEG